MPSWPCETKWRQTLVNGFRATLWIVTPPHGLQRGERPPCGALHMCIALTVLCRAVEMKNETLGKVVQLVARILRFSQPGVGSSMWPDWNSILQENSWIYPFVFITKRKAQLKSFIIHGSLLLRFLHLTSALRWPQTYILVYELLEITKLASKATNWFQFTSTSKSLRLRQLSFIRGFWIPFSLSKAF